MNWTHTLWHWYPCINSACARAGLTCTPAQILVQRLTRHHAWPDRFWPFIRFTWSACDCFLQCGLCRIRAWSIIQKWYLYGLFWHLTWYSLQLAKTLLFIVKTLLNQTCHSFVNIGLIQTHRPRNLVMPDRVQSPLLFFACVLPDLQNLPKWPEPYTHKNYQCFFADKTGVPHISNYGA